MHGVFLIWACLTGLATALPNQPQRQTSDRNSAILTIGGTSFTLSAPDGWVLDDTSGRQQGVAAVFYPKGSSWIKGTAVMYVNMVQKGPGKEDLTKVIDSDIAEFRRGSADSTAADDEAVPTRDDKRT